MEQINAMQNKVFEQAKALREKLDRAFGQDTARPGTISTIASAGHCAAAAAIVQQELGGILVSAIVKGESHWYNRVNVTRQTLDLDITGDQFGFQRVRIAPAGTLYEGSRVRRPEELDQDTRVRAATLAKRAGLGMTS